MKRRSGTTVGGIFLLLMACLFGGADPARSQGRVADAVRSAVPVDGKGERLLSGTDAWVRHSWDARRDFDGTYALRVTVHFEPPGTTKGRIVLEIGDERFGVERRELSLRSGLPLEMAVDPMSVDVENRLVVTLRPLEKGPAFRAGASAVVLERWNRPIKVYPARRAVEAERLDDGLFRLSEDGHRVHYRFDGMDSPDILRIVGAARIPLPPEGELLRPRRIVVGVGNRLGGMRYEHPLWLPGARERVPVTERDVNLLGTVDVVLGWAEGGGELLLGPQDVWLEVYKKNAP